MNENKYVTVSELTKFIKLVIDENPYLQRVYIKGEISNFKSHTSGHFYFTIKDESSRINAIMFSTSNKKLVFTPKDGMKVLVTGRISVYEANGGYQIYVDDMLEDGIGNLYIAFEQLKEKLQKEGLFNLEHKKRIPKIPNRVGIITAPTGAAIKDILSTIKRRFPLCETILFPSLVQGTEAVANIVKQIKNAEGYNLDVLIVGRGGGSIEDLWPFNEEIVARAIFECKIPVISAVGHEIDYTISDFVADLRAPTPTGAAEIAVPNISDILNYINQVKIRLNESLKKKIEVNKLLLNKLKTSYILTKPMTIYEIKGQKLDNLMDKLISITKIKIDNNKVKCLNLIEKLEVLNPLNVIKRGYAVVKKDNLPIADIKRIKINDILNIDIKNGSITTLVTDIKE
jgi:exodeoxyribonuclease VII large subunit